MEVDHQAHPEQVPEQDLYLKMKELEKELELLSMQEEYLRDEQRHLKSEYIRSKEEVSPQLTPEPAD